MYTAHCCVAGSAPSLANWRAISVGTNPHFAGTVRRVETYVLDRDDLDLYGHAIAVRFVERIRGQLTFDDLDGLIDQMTSDVEVARRLLEPRG